MTAARLAVALRQTVARLRSGTAYQWGHFGACNCGQVAQTLTSRSQAEIHRAALERASQWGASPVDDWGDAAVEYCPASGLPIDDIVTEMLAAGMTLQQIRDLERLSDRHILRRLPMEKRHLVRNRREDVATYMETWAEMIEETLLREPLAAE